MGRNLTDIEVSPDGKSIYLVDRGETDSQLIIVSAQGFSRMNTMPLGRYAGDIAFFPEGRYGYVLGMSAAGSSKGTGLLRALLSGCRLQLFPTYPIRKVSSCSAELPGLIH